MTGGLFKSTSRMALVAVAGLLAGSVAAQAADLGGDCCADLEERVAELETTTVRKGNRRVSLTISGHVNKALMYWNDGGRSNTYFGLDNGNTSTRINFAGNARISPTVTAGFNMLIEVSGSARGFIVNQLSEDGADSIGGSQDHRISMRDANWWIESSSIGRITMGRLVGEGPKGVVDIGGIGVIAPGTTLTGGSLLFRNSAGVLTAIQITNLWDGGIGDYGKRVDGVRYTSPNILGFTLSANVGEASKVERATTLPELAAGGPIGRTYGASLTYAGEFSGVRVAAAAGYERIQGKEIINPSLGATSAADGTNKGVSLSLRHVPTGLFAQAMYTLLERQEYDAAGAVRGVLQEAKTWGIQAGITQNYFGIGATSIYGEYFKNSNGQATLLAGPANDVASGMKVWGLGIVQNIDAAAMEVYMGYRNHAATSGLHAVGLQDISTLVAGARIRF